MSQSRTEAARRAEAERFAREGRTEKQKAATEHLIARRKQQAAEQRAARQAAKQQPSAEPVEAAEPDGGLQVRDAAYPPAPPRPAAAQQVEQDVQQDVQQEVTPPPAPAAKPLEMTNNDRPRSGFLQRVLGTGENHGRAAKRK